jgi:hypothetical protein
MIASFLALMVLAVGLAFLWVIWWWMADAFSDYPHAAATSASFAAKTFRNPDSSQPNKPRAVA